MKSTLFNFATLCLFSLVNGQTSSEGNSYNLLIGTYTQPGKSDGIYVYKFNADTGEFSYLSEASGIKNPSYLTVSKDKRYVYSVNEIGNGNGGASAFSFDPVSGKIDFINYQASGGNGPCYISVDDQNRFAFVANYGGGSLAAIPINRDGSLGLAIQSIRHGGGSSVARSQDRPHVHSTVLSPDNRFLFASDLGTDKVNIYRVDYSKPNPLTSANPEYTSVEAGSGPRHFVFHPNGKFAYLIKEIDGSVTVFDYKDGKLSEKQSVILTPSNYKSENGTPDSADIHISPDGKFLYGSLRSNINELVIYAIGSDGKLLFAGRQSTLGKNPRNFAIDPTGNFLLVGNSGDDEIVIFRRDQKAGLLKDTGKRIEVGAPVCLKFVAMH
ncbi:lactonase family protein [Flavobacteriaceae bacterium F89]|uniref:Lactonase family protein n=1 Tax=Cerina litoralis TaxID=2874477 RepID=A0AAE3JR63_9FLAO|nr:lactonase family protein [Cerina litoralis]MCG2459317.1 lactonase family protein [Cerina litoralis]